MGGARKLMRRYFLPLFDLGGDFAALGPVGRCEEPLFLSFTITFVLLTALFAVVQPCLIGSGAVRGQQQIVLAGAVAQI